MTPIRRLLASDKVRFLIAGGSTTAFSYALYLALLATGLDAMRAYVASYAAGIVWAYTVTSLWVFRVPWTWRGLFQYPVVYAAQAIVSIGVFHLLVKRLGVAPWIAPLVTVIVALPLTYVISRALLVGRGPRASGN